ncbi:MAG: hypothetical protein AABY11_02500 [archaeon]
MAQIIEETKGKAAKAAAAAAPPKARKRKGVDKWKSKKWFNILAPALFNNTPLTQTPGEEAENIMNRIVSVSAREMTGNIKKSQLMLKFKVNNVQGLNAYTTLHGIEFQPGSVRRLVRRKSSKVELVVDVPCKDGALARVKTIAITGNMISAPKRTAVRDILREGVKTIASQNDYETMVNLFVTGEPMTDALAGARKVAPMKRIDILKVTRLG